MNIHIFLCFPSTFYIHILHYLTWYKKVIIFCLHSMKGAWKSGRDILNELKSFTRNKHDKSIIFYRTKYYLISYIIDEYIKRNKICKRYLDEDQFFCHIKSSPLYFISIRIYLQQINCVWKTSNKIIATYQT